MRHCGAGMDALPLWPCCPCWSSSHGRVCILNATAGLSRWSSSGGRACLTLVVGGPRGDG